MTLENEKNRWEEQTLEPVLKKFPERKPEFRDFGRYPRAEG